MSSLAARDVAELKAPPRYIPISQAARELGVTARALRFYQDQGLIRSHRLARSIRAYDPETVATLQTIIALRDADLSITTIREILALRSDPQAQRIATRRALLEVLADKRRQVARIEDLIAETDPSGGADTGDAAVTL